ncbi:hypothetical protein D3C80_780840 [compost metagenome]
MPCSRRRFDAMGIIKIDPQLIDGVFRNDRQLFGRIFPLHLMLLQQREQLLRIAPVHKWIEENTIVKQIVAFSGAHVMWRLRARISDFRIENTAHRSVIALLVKMLHYLRGCQHFVVIPLHPGVGVLFIGPTQRIQIDASLHDDWLIEGKPARDFCVIAFEHLLRITNEQLDDMFRRPAPVGFQQNTRQFVMLKADHRLDALPVHFVEQRVVI